MYSGQIDPNATVLRLYWLGTIVLACAAAVVLYYSLPWGIGVSPDSISYLKAASRLTEDFQLKHLPSHWPPGYPLYLAIMMSAIPGMTTAALFGQVTLFFFNTILVSWVVLYCLQDDGTRRYWAALIAAAVFACNPTVLLMHQ